MGRTRHGRAKRNAKRTHNCCIFGIMDGTASTTWCAVDQYRLLAPAPRPPLITHPSLAAAPNPAATATNGAPLAATRPARVHTLSSSSSSCFSSPPNALARTCSIVSLRCPLASAARSAAAAANAAAAASRPSASKASIFSRNGYAFINKCLLSSIHSLARRAIAKSFLPAALTHGLGPPLSRGRRVGERDLRFIPPDNINFLRFPLVRLFGRRLRL